MWSGALLVVASVLGSLGCPSANEPTVGDVVGDAVTEILNELNNTVVIRLVNQTGMVVEFDINVDGLPRTLRCPQTSLNVGQEICDFPQAECPLLLEPTEFSMLNSSGGFSGGENYYGDEGFSFAQGRDYECGDYIMYRFTADSSEALVLH